MQIHYPGKVDQGGAPATGTVGFLQLASVALSVGVGCALSWRRLRSQLASVASSVSSAIRLSSLMRSPRLS